MLTLEKKFSLKMFAKITKKFKFFSNTVDVVYTWKYGGPHIIITICANEMCVYNAYVLQG